MYNKNKNASIWEVTVLYAMQKMFPTLKWTNEVKLSDVSCNSSIDPVHRKYDVYSPVIKSAIEVSRIGAHSSKKHYERDVIKQRFSDENHIRLYHLRENLCDNKGLTNVYSFTVGKNTGDISYPIDALCSGIEDIASNIERTFGIVRTTNINYGIAEDEIKLLYKKISGRYFDTTSLLSEVEMANVLGIDFEEFVLFSASRNMSYSEAFMWLQNNKTKYVGAGNFLAKNKKEAVCASNAFNDIVERKLSEKDAEIQRLQELINEMTHIKADYKTSTADFEILRKKSSYVLLNKRKVQSKTKIELKRKGL